DSDNGADVRRLRSRAPLRSSLDNPAAKAVAAAGRRPGDCRRQFAAGRTRRAESHRVEQYGLQLEDVRTLLSSQNANRPKGDIADNTTTSILATNDQLLKADAYKPLVVSYQNGAVVKLADIATVQDSVEDLRAAGMTNGK